MKKNIHDRLYHLSLVSDSGEQINLRAYAIGYVYEEPVTELINKIYTRDQVRFRIEWVVEEIQLVAKNINILEQNVGGSSIKYTGVVSSIINDTEFAINNHYLGEIRVKTEKSFKMVKENDYISVSGNLTLEFV